ncbi:hypothetical protein F2Q69_00048393 [Brassica cretica]|uniref:Uncharacterized protein n=2 Tax=Brassica cretica TaxID=69181 RepID=A0A8S9PET5_BRACR|nr:hypothetical protein DY000_02060846 [Brassica cretica]KAF3522043.1 hypothetical protein F2Q69_00048393 [Brassica cretica]
MSSYISNGVNGGDRLKLQPWCLCLFSVHSSSARSSSVRDAVDVRSRPPVVIALRRVSSTSASPRLKPTPSPSPNHVLSLCRVSAPS